MYKIENYIDYREHQGKCATQKKFHMDEREYRYSILQILVRPHIKLEGDAFDKLTSSQECILSWQYCNEAHFNVKP